MIPTSRCPNRKQHPTFESWRAAYQAYRIGVKVLTDWQLGVELHVATSVEDWLYVLELQHEIMLRSVYRESRS